MKTKKIITSAIGFIGLAAFTFITSSDLLAQPVAPPPPTVPAPAPVVPPSAPAVVVQPPVAVQPSVVIPAPGISVNIGVPETYTWDGYEYVGVIGSQYYYLGPGNVWTILPADRLTRFRVWEKEHHDWRDHAIQNQLYRRDALGHDHPRNDHDGDHSDHFQH
jgi:hypothetical protein